MQYNSNKWERKEPTLKLFMIQILHQIKQKKNIEE